MITSIKTWSKSASKVIGFILKYWVFTQNLSD